MRWLLAGIHDTNVTRSRERMWTVICHLVVGYSYCTTKDGLHQPSVFSIDKEFSKQKF